MSESRESESPGAAPTDSELVERANKAFYAALERGDLEDLSGLWLDEDPDGASASALTDSGTGDEHDPDTDSDSDAKVTRTAVPSCVHPGWPLLTGRGEVLRSYALIMAHTEYIQFFLTDVTVSVASDTALVTCTENILSGAPPEEGSELGPLVGQLVVATNVFRRTADGWKLWSHHASPVLAESDSDDDDDEDEDQAPA